MTKKTKKRRETEILKLSKENLDIQTEQCEPLLQEIETRLSILYPNMPAGTIPDWASEFVNIDTLSDRKRIFMRLRNLYG